MRKVIFVLLVTLILSIIGFFLTQTQREKEEITRVEKTTSLSPTPSPVATPIEPDPKKCRENVFGGVYSPKRFKVYKLCAQAIGTVSLTFKNIDGDWHVHIRPDSEYEFMLNEANRALGNELVTEVIPKDQDKVPIPKTGERVLVIGAFVQDLGHDWNELHPAWEITKL